MENDIKMRKMRKMRKIWENLGKFGKIKSSKWGYKDRQTEPSQMKKWKWKWKWNTNEKEKDFFFNKTKINQNFRITTLLLEPATLSKHCLSHNNGVWKLESPEAFAGYILDMVWSKFGASITGRILFFWAYFSRFYKIIKRNVNVEKST